MKFLFIFIIAILSVYHATAQQSEVDSLTQLYHKAKQDTTKANLLYSISKFYAFTQSDTAMQLAKESLKFAEKANYKKGRANAYSIMGRIEAFDDSYSRKPKSEERALALFEKAKSIYENIGDKRGVGVMYENMAFLIRHKQGKYELALDYYLKSYKAYESAESAKDKADALEGASQCYAYLKRNEEAEQGFKRAISIAETLKDEVYMADKVGSLASFYNATLNYKKAISLGLKYLRYAEEKKSKSLVQNMRRRLGGIYYSQRNYKTAKVYYEKYINNSEDFGKKDEGTNYRTVAIIYVKLKEETKALDILIKAAQVYRKSKNYSQELDINFDIADLYNSLKNYDSALAHYDIGLPHQIKHFLEFQS